MTMKKSFILLTTTCTVLALSGCCFFMSPPPEPVKPAPAPAKAAVVTPAPVAAAVLVAPTPAPPADSDKDGVIDEKDNCPGTAAGVAVDTKGCPLDTDKDGVIDTNDLCPETVLGTAVDKRGCTIAIEEKIRMSIGALFASGKADITENSTDDIKKLGVFMQTYPTTTTVIEGHTDNVGTAAMNKELSQRRAEAVRVYLIKNYNIDPNRIKAVGYGFDRPVADNATAQGRRMNRRIEAAIETTVLKPQ